MTGDGRLGAVILSKDIPALFEKYALLRNESRDLWSIRYLGDPVLNTPATDVRSRDKVPHDLIAALRRERDRAWTSGVGLSAQQIGGTERVSIICLGTVGVGGQKLPGTWHRCINMRIVERSERTVVSPSEGCLSIPNFRTTTHRHTWVMVEYRDPATWELLRKKLVGYDAQVAQHECDHLDGILITDRCSRQQKRAAERLTKKYLERLQR